MKQISKQDYATMVKEVSPPSPKLKNCLWAFFVGGGICAFGQVLFHIFSYFGIKPDLCYTLVAITIIVLTAILTGLGLFDKIAKRAGAGTLVPVSGFANAVVSPAIEFKSEGIVLGLSAKLFSIAGPVILFGITASVIYGIIYWLTALF